jgi:hypothetical protein
MADASVEQQVAGWFAERLAQIRTSVGYAMTLDSSRIFIDGDPENEEAPTVPFAEYDDNQGSWSDAANTSGKSAIHQYQPTVKITVQAGAADYKAVARGVFDDVVRACAHDGWCVGVPLGVNSILPDSWARQRRDGNYLDVAITFTVRLAVDTRSRPLIS